MKTWTILFFALSAIACTVACKGSAYVHHHAVRMVDAKSYLDHPVSASLYYYK